MMKFLGLKNLATMIAILVVATDGEKLPIAKPGCSDRCGNVSIPYPFGTMEGCYRNGADHFFVNCTGERAFSSNSSMEITNISLSGGHLTVMQLIWRDCYDLSGRRVTYEETTIALPRFTRVSDTANKFVVVGCDTFGSIHSQRLDGRDYTAGCIATCDGVDDVEDGTCTGSGCCESSIPRNIQLVNISLESYDNYKNVAGDNKCGYAFVVEESSFAFSRETITSLRNVTKLPMVVDWAVGDANCSEAKANPSHYACKSVNSECYENDNGYGYRCNCTHGYQGNPYLVHGCQDIDECKQGLHNCTQPEFCVNTNGSFECRCPKGYKLNARKYGNDCTKSESPVFRLVAGISLGIIVLLLSACGIYLVHQNRRIIKMRQHYFHQNGGMLLQQKLHLRERSPDSVKIYTQLELQTATNNFHSSMIIGEGANGTVYKGFVQGDGVVAIKKANKAVKQIDQFTNELIVLSKIKHKNVVKLLGCCLETEVPLLVYEFVNNGTLSQHLLNKDKSRLLSWEMRLRIAQEVASVLAYLHSDAASTPIIHRDVKCSNILVDDSFTAKVADFGASRLIPLDPSEMSTVLQGTMGYLDPEYMQTNKFNEKSDVYSFGVVLVVLLTGLRPMDFNRPEEEITLANLFLMKQNALNEILDENVVTDPDNEEDVRKVCDLAQSCLRVRREDRPSMKEVAMELERVRIGEHSRNRPDCGFDGIVMDGGGSSSVRCDSLRDYMIVHGGR